MASSDSTAKAYLPAGKVVSPKRAATGSVIVPRTKSWERAAGAVPSNNPTANAARLTKCTDSDRFCVAFIDSSNFNFRIWAHFTSCAVLTHLLGQDRFGPGAKLVAQLQSKAGTSWFSPHVMHD